MSSIDEILELLATDGNIHSIEEISRELALPLIACEHIASFLAKYNAIKISNRYLKINPRIRDFIISSSDKSPIRIPLLTSQSIM